MCVCVNNTRREKAVAQSLIWSVWSMTCIWGQRGTCSEQYQQGHQTSVGQEGWETAMKSPWNHNGITMKSPWNHHEITMKSQWHHHEITMKSPWNHHDITTRKSPWSLQSRSRQDMEPSEMQHILKEEGEMITATWRAGGSLARFLRGGSVFSFLGRWGEVLNGFSRWLILWQPDAPRLLLRSCSLDCMAQEEFTGLLDPLCMWMAFCRAHPTAERSLRSSGKKLADMVFDTWPRLYVQLSICGILVGYCITEYHSDQGRVMKTV